MKKIHVLISIIVISVITVIIFTQIYDFNKNEEKSPIRMSINPFPGTDYAFIAKEKSIFEKNNVKVELVLNPQYSKTIELFYNGDVDGAFEVYTDAIIQHSNGIDSKVVYIMDYSTDGDVIVGTADSLSDLKGKKIGINGVQSFSHYFVIKSLERIGLSEADVFFEDIEETDIVQALDDGKIQAGHTWEPNKSLALKKGYKVIDKAGNNPGIILDVVVFNSNMLEERPDDVKAIIKSLVEAREFAYSNKKESLEIMSSIEGLSVEEMNLAFNDAYRPSLEENIKMLKAKPMKICLYIN